MKTHKECAACSVPICGFHHEGWPRNTANHTAQLSGDKAFPRLQSVTCPEIRKGKCLETFYKTENVWLNNTKAHKWVWVERWLVRETRDRLELFLLLWLQFSPPFFSPFILLYHGRKACEIWRKRTFWSPYLRCASGKDQLWGGEGAPTPAPPSRHISDTAAW